MKRIRSKFVLFVLASLFLSLIAAPLVNVGPVQAQENGPELIEAATTVPTPVLPSGTITDRTPTFKWTKITGATKYRIEVYRGTTKLYYRDYTSAYCGTTYCQATPGTTLAYAAHKWHVRAYKSGWKSNSGFKSFTVKAPVPGFNSQFTGGANGWTRVYGSWVVTSSAYKTSGVSGKVSSTAHVNNYSTLDYSVRMKKVGGQDQGLVIRGNPTVLNATKDWKGYQFRYVNARSFSVWRINSSTSMTSLQYWTGSFYIKANDWNTLRVVAKGSSLKFYINGNLVWSGNDSTFSTGKVGIYSAYTGTLLVDWATLKTTVSSADADLSEPLAEKGPEFPLPELYSFPR